MFTACIVFIFHAIHQEAVTTECVSSTNTHCKHYSGKQYLTQEHKKETVARKILEKYGEGQFKQIFHSTLAQLQYIFLAMLQQNLSWYSNENENLKTLWCSPIFPPTRTKIYKIKELKVAIVLLDWMALGKLFHFKHTTRDCNNSMQEMPNALENASHSKDKIYLLTERE